jgi:hypothetical protein
MITTRRIDVALSAELFLGLVVLALVCAILTQKLIKVGAKIEAEEFMP